MPITEAIHIRKNSTQSLKFQRDERGICSAMMYNGRRNDRLLYTHCQRHVGEHEARCSHHKVLTWLEREIYVNNTHSLSYCEEE